MLRSSSPPPPYLWPQLVLGCAPSLRWATAARSWSAESHPNCRAPGTRRLEPFEGSSCEHWVAASPLPRAATAHAPGSTLPSLLLSLSPSAGLPPSSSPASRPVLLGPAPSLFGVLSREVVYRLVRGLPPRSVRGFSWEVCAPLAPTDCSSCPWCRPAAQLDRRGNHRRHVCGWHRPSADHPCIEVGPPPTSPQQSPLRRRPRRPSLRRP